MGGHSFEREILIPTPKEKSEEEEEEEVEEPLIAVPEEEDAGGIHWGKDLKQEETWRRKTGGGVTLEGYVDGGDGIEDRTDGVARTKSLRGEDLEELKGCLDLGFGFNYDEIPELCNTLPALELCYSMSQRFLDEQQHNRSLDRSSSGDSLDLCESPSSPLVANWKIASPGDDPDEVKARLKYWAQAVACTIRLCN
ncbi:uncharacterized protein LOC122055330 [Zingiber officinale]|uniref:uncharacterized protein LOC122055330 n=1 Tax=Zingiber officinale TaxID=94328 RepID=UPI001C4CB3E4|nr:uncharacterized protein LOC122055330 [Zingiber officinale]